MGGDNVSFFVVFIRKICFNIGIEYKMFMCRKCFKCVCKNVIGIMNCILFFCIYLMI